AAAAVVIGGRRPDRRIDDAAIDIDGEERPDIRAGTIPPALAFPRLDARLAGARHGVERPEQLAAARVPSTDVAVQAGARRLLAVVAAGDDDVLVDGRRRREAEPAVHLAAHARLQIDEALGPESAGGLAALRLDREQPIAGAREETRRRVAIAGPVRDAAAADGGGRRVAPDHLRGFGFERDDVPAGGDVHDAADDERCHLQPGRAGVERPRRLELHGARRRNLRDERETAAARVVIVRRPVTV